MWVARDKDGRLFLFYTKPVRCSNMSWDVPDTDVIEPMILLDKSLFPNLTWDDESVEVELKIKKQ